MNELLKLVIRRFRENSEEQPAELVAAMCIKKALIN